MSIQFNGITNIYRYKKSQFSQKLHGMLGFTQLTNSTRLRNNQGSKTSPNNINSLLRIILAQEVLPTDKRNSFYIIYVYIEREREKKVQSTCFRKNARNVYNILSKSQ